MPAPKSRRKAQPTGEVDTTSCLCGGYDPAAWCTAQAVLINQPLAQLREFYASLRPAAKKAVLQAGPTELLAQVIDATDLALPDAQEMGPFYLSDEAVMAAVRTFCEQVLNGECVEMPSGRAGQQPAMRMPDELVQLTCAKAVGPSLVTKHFGGSVPIGTSVLPSKQGLVSFPSNQPGLLDSVREANSSGICKPAQNIHFRPWLGEDETALYKSTLDATRLLGTTVVVMCRRLHRAMMRAQLVKLLVSGGLATPSLTLAHTYQTWSWGQGQQGQLGLGTPNHADMPTPVPALCGKKVVQVAAAGQHAFARLANGELLSWGAGSYGVTACHELEPSRVPLPCSAQPSDAALGAPLPVDMVSTGDLHTLVLRKGRVHGCGLAWMGQLGNTEMLMGGGCLLPWNEASHEQLCSLKPAITVTKEYAQMVQPALQRLPTEEEENGRYPACQTTLSMQPVTHGPIVLPQQHSFKPGAAFTGVVTMAAGSWHSVAARTDGSVWVWGCNEGGALGVQVEAKDMQQAWVQVIGCPCCDGEVISVSAPTRVDLSSVAAGKAVQVAAGSSISVVLTDQGEVVSWGAAQKPPWRVDTHFQGDTGLLVAAGGPYGMAVTRQSGHVWTWFRHHQLEWRQGPEQQLVNKSQARKAWAPVKVPFLENVCQAACSPTHGLAATRDGRVFWWPHSAVYGQSGDGHGYEVVTLQGLRVLSVAVGDGFAVVATGPPADMTAEEEVEGGQLDNDDYDDDDGDDYDDEEDEDGDEDGDGNAVQN